VFRIDVLSNFPLFAGLLVNGLETLRAEAVQFRGSAFASTTQKMYRSHLKSYLNFCCQYEVSPVPAEQDTLVAYMAFLARTLSPSSIPAYMKIVRLLHLDSGFRNPLESNWELKMTYKGISRQLGWPTKDPVTPAVLLLLHRTLENHRFDHAFWFACLVAYFGFLRKSTLLPQPGNLISNKFLARGDVTEISLESFLLTVRKSKTIQFGQKVHTVPYAACPDTRLCPVRALFRHFGSSKLPSTSPLFNYVEKSLEVRMTHASFMKRLRSGLVASGLNPLEISCHSYRSGGASLAFAAGMSAVEIKMRGDWASNAFERYVFVDNHSALATARLLACSVNRI
jgi:hypothetical protein